MDFTWKTRIGNFIFLIFGAYLGPSRRQSYSECCNMLVVVEPIFKIFRHKSDFQPFLRSPIVLKSSEMDSTWKIRIENFIFLIFGAYLGPSRRQSYSEWWWLQSRFLRFFVIKVIFSCFTLPNRYEIIRNGFCMGNQGRKLYFLDFSRLF